MQVSAEVRWFWRDACPPEVREWFHEDPTAPIPPGGPIARAGPLSSRKRQHGNRRHGNSSTWFATTM